MADIRSGFATPKSQVRTPQIKVTNQRYGSVCYALTSGYHIWRTIDGGNSWQILGLIDEVWYLATPRMSWLNPQVGLIAAAGVYRTVNGGNDWTEVLPHYESYEDAVILPDGRAWAVGAVGVMKYSDDAGATWSAVSLPSIGSAHLYSVDAYYTSTGLACYASGAPYSSVGVILTSSDGASWTLRSSGAGNHDVHTIRCGHTTSTSKYAVAMYGDAGTSFVRYAGDSSDYGATWSDWDSLGADTSSNNNLASVSGIYGRLCGFNGKVQRSSNGGADWTQLTAYKPISALAYLGDKEIWMAAASYVYRSIDAGASWERVLTTPSGTIQAMALTSGFVQIGQPAILEVS